MTDRHRHRRRRVMQEFTISEISAVDRPAQAHAKAVILKRGDSISQQEQGMDFRKITSFRTLGDAMAHLRAAHGMSPLDAMQQAARMDGGALVEKYNREGEAAAEARASQAVAKGRSRASQDFDALVDLVMERDGVNKLQAMQKARRENPGAFRRYQES